MFQSSRHNQRSAASGTMVDIAPLIDVVFILLIFFLVTATFQQPTGMEVNKPQARHTQGLKPQSLRVSIAPSGALYTGGEAIDLADFRDRVGQFKKNNKQGAVIVVPDKESTAGRMMRVMDAAKEGGAKDVSVATQRR
jgi:biopolymer transport protein ExbD